MQESEYQPPCEFRGGLAHSCGAAYQNAQFGRSLFVDGGVSHTGGGEQFQPRQLLEQVAEKGGAFGIGEKRGAAGFKPIRRNTAGFLSKIHKGDRRFFPTQTRRARCGIPKPSR